VVPRVGFEPTLDGV